LAGILPMKTKGLANTQACCKCTCKEFVLEREKLIYHFCSYKALGGRGRGGECVGSPSSQHSLVFFPLAFQAFGCVLSPLSNYLTDTKK
jgi:hypothetical protein